MPKKENQKLRVLYIAKFFYEYSDENHSVSSRDIIDYLEEEYNIVTDRRTIYRDIAALRDGLGLDIEGGQGGRYRLLSRDFELDDLRLIAECVYAAKFISEPKAKELVETISCLCSHYQAEDLCGDVFLCDRIKSTQKGTLTIISTIRRAMATYWDGLPHTPQKVSFLYMRRSKVEDKNTPKPSYWGRRFIVSPYKLLLNDGNYYLLAYADNVRGMRTYRIDRMKDVRLEHGPRVGAAEFEKINIAKYVRQTLFMVSGEVKQISILCDNDLLDMIIDRFGTGPDVFYRPEGKRQFVVTMEVAITGHFFGWLCSLGTKAKITAPKSVSDEAKAYFEKLANCY